MEFDFLEAIFKTILMAYTAHVLVGTFFLFIIVRLQIKEINKKYRCAKMPEEKMKYKKKVVKIFIGDSLYEKIFYVSAFFPVFIVLYISQILWYALKGAFIAGMAAARFRI